MQYTQTGNPTLSQKVFSDAIPIGDEGLMVMTEKGTLNKFGFCMLLVIGAAAYTWSAYFDGSNVMPWVIGGAIVGLILALFISFKPHLAGTLTPIYALAKGVFVGGISALYNNAFEAIAPGIVMQAVGLTFGVIIAMFLLYRFRIIKVTQKLKSIIITATVGIAAFYFLSIILGLFGINMPLIHSSSWMGIGFSLFVVGLAAMNLLLDFDMIEKGIEMRAPKYMEWYGAFALIVTIVWLYIEILRLLSKISRR